MRDEYEVLLIKLCLYFQRSQVLGNRVEMEVADAIAQNDALLRLNLQFDTLGPRVRVTEKLKQNLDACKNKPHFNQSSHFILVRQKRLNKKQ